MTKEEFDKEVRDLMDRALRDDELTADEILAVVGFQAFAIFLARAHANADSRLKDKMKGNN